MKFLVTILFVVLAINLQAQGTNGQGTRIVAAARQQIGVTKEYDPAYVTLDYPGGDVPINTGVCSDVVVRAVRQLGLDLQKEVHEDMRRNFRLYPQKWGLRGPDKNIDHRRVPNLMRYFERHHVTVRENLQKAETYIAGDIVTWDLGRGLTHIGIVSDKKAGKTPLIIHNIGSGAALVALMVLSASGRLVEWQDFPKLMSKSELVFVGKVKAVKRFGITTKLAYPTWDKTVFEWLRVEVEVMAPIKGTKKGQIVQTMLLSADETPMINAPGMVEAKAGGKFLFCLAATTETNAFAAITAPFDDDLAIFPLDRNYWQYNSFREGKEKKGGWNYELHETIWRLVDDAGKISPEGAEQVRSTYAKEIKVRRKDGVIYLQWEAKTNAAGWTANFPKTDGQGTNSQSRTDGHRKRR